MVVGGPGFEYMDLGQIRGMLLKILSSMLL